ncbi:uncharacterized protein LOC132050733 [Lycium ferocissimum]|uniref:uncharacterized protein LOC132050733 n=1 Tax=Lycium ferocissimum TaxID=112874 RepID=UPI0028165F5F|nr:uncharacterized protein LOC132050733 [Lycium ferocissimum]
MASKTNDGADSSVVLTPFFDGNDFEYWKIRMRTYLKAEGLWTIVANGYEEPKDDGELSVAEMKNLEAKRRQVAKALNKIQMGVSKAFFAKIATCETVKQAWESLEAEVYGDEKVRTINLQTLRREFQNLKMIESEKIDEYCTRVLNIVNEMRNHGDEISNQQVVEKILISVTEKYEYIVAITEETKDLSKLSVTPQKCWHKGKPQCNFCKKFGHIEKDYRHKQQEQVNSCEGKEEEKEENLFYASQSDVSAKSNEWYVDNGCTDHMTGDEKAFLSINHSITSKVRMGNGALIDAKGRGTISINRKGSGKQIHDVLYVPDLEENLLSVGQLMENGYSLVFRDNCCRIYDKIEPNQDDKKKFSFTTSLQCIQK